MSRSLFMSVLSRALSTLRSSQYSSQLRARRIYQSPAIFKIMNKSYSSSSLDGLDAKSFSPDEYFEAAPELRRRESTIEDELRLVRLLNELLAYQDKTVSSWVVENNVKDLVGLYKLLTKPQKEAFLKVLASQYSVDHEKVQHVINKFKETEAGSAAYLKAEEELKSTLSPRYLWLFKYISRLEHGVKFLVDMRTDLLKSNPKVPIASILSRSITKNQDLLSTVDNRSGGYSGLQGLNSTLRELLSLWFSVGFLSLERVTWRSSCEMLQKISEYEAVHPVRSWTDLKRRVGPYRRCFVYTHSSMPAEPIVVLHTALTREIAASMRGIVTATQRMSIDAGRDLLQSGEEAEDPDLVTAAIFYSISSTQRGLQGIELGNYLIKRVVRELQAEFPRVSQFSTLSPIPGFKTWLLERIKLLSRGELVDPAWAEISEQCGGWSELRRHLVNNSWRESPQLTELLEGALTSLCASYLYREKRRGAALCPVANFHLKNGAVMWRLNWLADSSPRGMSNSCGLMVNYRYYLEELEANSEAYIEKKMINASEQFKQLLNEKIQAKI